MSGLTKTEKKRQHAQRASSSAGVASPSVASTVRKRSVDSVMKRKASLDSVVSKRMRSKNSASKLGTHGTSPRKSGTKSSLNSPRGALWDEETERPTPESSCFQVHVYAGECPGAHAAFFDSQALGDSGSGTKITLLPRTTKLGIKNLKKKKNKARSKKKDAELDDPFVSKEDSGDSSTSETRTADAADVTDPPTPTHPTANGDTASSGLHHVDNYDYVLMVLPHSASVGHARSSSLSLLPKRALSQFTTIVNDVHFGELPVGECVSILLSRSKSQTRVGIVSLSRCDGAYASYDCMYTAVRNSLAHFYNKASPRPNGEDNSKLLLILPSLDRVKWNNKYPTCTEAAAAAFQIQLAIDIFGCCAEGNRPELLTIDRMLQKGPQKIASNPDELVIQLLRDEKLLERGLRDSKEVSSLIAAASRDENTSDDEHDQILQDMAIHCIAEIISSRSSAIDENLGLFLRQNVLTTQSCLKRVIELAQNGEILLHRPVQMKDVVQLEKIGAGGTATVYKGTYKGKPAAIKLFFEDCPLPELRRELALMSLLEHPQLARLIGASGTCCTRSRARREGLALPDPEDSR